MQNERAKFRAIRKRDREKRLEDEIERYNKEENPWNFLMVFLAGRSSNYNSVGISDEIETTKEEETPTEFLVSDVPNPERQVALTLIVNNLSPDAQEVAREIIKLTPYELSIVSKHLLAFIKKITGSKRPGKIERELRRACLSL